MSLTAARDASAIAWQSGERDAILEGESHPVYAVVRLPGDTPAGTIPPYSEPYKCASATHFDLDACSWFMA